MEENAPLVALRGVVKRYGHTTAIKDLSLDINEGSFTAIFGPNGAGKSTLLKILSNQTRPTAGKILYSGLPASKLSDSFRSGFGVISHQPFVYENLSARENLEFYASLYGVKNAKERASELLKKVNLYARRDDPVRTFSRGMLQRVSIARALLHDPAIIFLDEPYTGLDSVAAASLTDILREQLEGKKTILMVTHDLKIGLDLASRVVIMKKGRIVYLKDKKDINASDFESIYLEQAGEKEAAE